MFEILLQADQALAGGDLDQAEQAYWQLVEIDGSNTIAMAGLAQVAFQRGDKRLARAFAERALKVDPDSVSARKIMAALEGRETGSAADEAGLRAQVANLEALGKRKRSTSGEAGGGAAAKGGAAKEADAEGVAAARGQAEAQTADEAWAAEAARMEQEAIRAAEARAAEVLAALAQEEAEARAAEVEAAIEAAGEEEEPPAPTGKATAGERPAEAARPGRAVDPFSEAESAATIEAIVAADEAEEEQPAPAGKAERAQAELEDSERQLAAAERESAALAADTAPSRVSGAAEAAGRAAGTAAGPVRRPARGRFPAASPTSDDLDDELPDAVDTDEETSGRPIPIEAGAFGPDGTSEEDAEAAAMREAMDMIAEGETDKPGEGETEKPGEGDSPPRKGLFRRFRGG
jgi:hypothetical protein